MPILGLLDPTSLLTTFGTVGIFLILLAETGLLFGSSSPVTPCCSPRACSAPPRPPVR